MKTEKITEVLNIKYPVFQGPFGGGLSSAKLVSSVSEAGGLGGYGAYQLQPDEISDVVNEIRKQTAKPFNINLWVNDADEQAGNLSDEKFEQVSEIFRPYFDQLGIPLPPKPENVQRKFEKQAERILSLKPAVFSFVFGIPPRAIIDECRRQKIITAAAATTVDEALALQEAGIDLILASGFEAGGHRPSFLAKAEDSLHGTFVLVQQLSKKISKPIIAAGGISDAQGVRAAMQLGASAVQVGTAFLACKESGASDEYRNVMFSERSKYTSLTNVFTGRLARGIRGTIAQEMEMITAVLPFPLQSIFMQPLRKAAAEQGRTELLTFWAGQNVSLIHHRKVGELMLELTEPFR